MTRFLPRTLAGLEHKSFNNEIERLLAYHQATKHTYESVRRHARQLDWANQPNPFRVYEGAETIALPAAGELPEMGAFEAMARLEKAGALAADLDWISRLLWHSMAVSAWKSGFGAGGRY